MKTPQSGAASSYIQFANEFQRTGTISTPCQCMLSIPIWLWPKGLQYDGPRDSRCGWWCRYWNHTFDRPYFLAVWPRILSWITVTRVVPLYDKCDWEARGIILFYKSFSFWSLNQADHNGCTGMCDYAATDTSTILVISFLIVYALSLQDIGYAPCSASPLLNTYKTLTSSEKVLIYQEDPTLHYTSPNGVCSRSCTTDYLYTRSSFNWPLRTPRRYMTFRFHLDVKTWSAQYLLGLHCED